RTVLIVEEIRDAVAGKKMVFEPVQVVIDKDDLRSSLALKSVDAPVTRVPATAFDKVLVAVAECGTVQRRDDLIDPGTRGMSRANIGKAFADLVEMGLIVEDREHGIRTTAKGTARALELGAVVPDDDEDW